MQITRYVGGFTQTMTHPTVRALDCDCTQGTCTVQYADGSTRTHMIGCTVFNAQYGIPVSDDGQVLFVTSWEHGLRAVDAASGETRWQYPQSGLAQLILSGDRIFAHRLSKSLIALDAQTGAVSATLPLHDSDGIALLSPNRGLAWSNGGRARLIDLDTVTIARRYTGHEINPNRCLSVLIQSAAIEDDRLVLRGIECYPNGDYANATDYPFRRTIENWR